MSRYDVAIIALALLPLYAILAWIDARESGWAVGIFHAAFWYLLTIIFTHYWIHYVDNRNKKMQPMPGRVTFYCPNDCGKTVIVLDNGDAECLICGEVFEPYDKIDSGDPI